jgi:hypothetical protein
MRRFPRRLVWGTLVVVGLGAVWGYQLYQQGRANLRACGSYQPGSQRSELIKTFGSPTSREANPAGTRIVLTFTGPLFAERPIRAVVNVRDDVVMEIDCGDGRVHTHDKY